MPRPPKLSWETKHWTPCTLGLLESLPSFERHSWPEANYAGKPLSSRYTGRQGCSKSLEGKRFARPFISKRFYLDPVKGTKILSAEQPNSTVVILVSSRGLRISFLQLRPVIIAAGSDKIVLTCPSLSNVFIRLTDEGRQR